MAERFTDRDIADFDAHQGEEFVNARDYDRLLDALTEIARPDELVEANEDAFARHGFRRCQNIARNALDPGPGSVIPLDQAGGDAEK